MFNLHSKSHMRLIQVIAHQSDWHIHLITLRFNRNSNDTEISDRINLRHPSKNLALLFPFLFNLGLHITCQNNFKRKTENKKDNQVFYQSETHTWTTPKQKNQITSKHADILQFLNEISHFNHQEVERCTLLSICIFFRHITDIFFCIFHDNYLQKSIYIFNIFISNKQSGKLQTSEINKRTVLDSITDWILVKNHVKPDVSNWIRCTLRCE